LAGAVWAMVIRLAENKTGSNAATRIGVFIMAWRTG